MTEYAVRLQLSFSAFLSQLGGALNLWAGITIAVVIEIIELAFRVLSDCKKPVDEESDNPSAEVPQVSRVKHDTEQGPKSCRKNHVWCFEVILIYLTEYNHKYGEGWGHLFILAWRRINLLLKTAHISLATQMRHK